MSKNEPRSQPSTKQDVGNSLPGTSKHVVIPDGQVRPGVPLQHWDWVGNYISEKHPDFIHNMGDFNDMASLSSYDVGKACYEGRRYKDDIEYGKEAMATLMAPINKEKKRLKKRGLHWDPKLELYLGNHEHRIDRAVDDDPKLAGTLRMEDLGYEEFGWRVHPYLGVVLSDGIAFSHFFTSGTLGRPVTSARALIQKKHMSCIMGHVQAKGTHFEYRADGLKITGIFSGICYLHDEKYLGPQGNNTERGIWVLHNCKEGDFTELYVPLPYLQHKYS